MRTRQLVYANIRNAANPDRLYINIRGTLVTTRVHAQHHRHLNARVVRAKAAISDAKLRLHYADFNHIMGGARKIHSSIRPPSRVSKRRLAAAQAHLAMAESEVKTAMRIVAEHNAGRSIVGVVHASPVKMPRVWPNALPGGTSPRRAKANVWRMNKANDARAPF